GRLRRSSIACSTEGQPFEVRRERTRRMRSLLHVPGRTPLEESSLTFAGLDHLLDLLLHRIEVEGGRVRRGDSAVSAISSASVFATYRPSVQQSLFQSAP